eukprot:g8472.t1
MSATTTTKRELKRRKLGANPLLGAGSSTQTRSSAAQDADYFTSYGDLSVHRLMLQDRPRMDAYAAAIASLRTQIGGRTAMDVGTGSGILAILLVKLGGCRVVHAVEGCAKMAKLATDLVKKNGLEDRIFVHAKRVEELRKKDFLDVDAGLRAGAEKGERTIPISTAETSKTTELQVDAQTHSVSDTKAKETPEAAAAGGQGGERDEVAPVPESERETAVRDDASDFRCIDVLVSEWMGFHLLHEAMLDSVVFARDRFLKHQKEDYDHDDAFTPLILPDYCEILCAPLDLTEFRREKALAEKGYFHPDNFYAGLELQGFNEIFGRDTKLRLTAKEPDEKVEDFASNPNVSRGFSQSELLCAGKVMAKLDLKTITVPQLREIRSAPNALRFATNKPGLFGGVGIWFRCVFPGAAAEQYALEPAVELSTAPDRPSTHWKQSIVFLSSDGDNRIYAEVGEGEEIEFSLSLTQSAENKRWYEIGLET